MMDMLLYILFIFILVNTLFLYKKNLGKSHNEINIFKKRFIYAESKLQSLEEEAQKQAQNLIYAENQVRAKAKELIIKTRELDERNHLIELIRNKITEAMNNPAKTTNRLHEIDLELDKILKVEDHTFEMQMDEFHQDFMKLLKSKFPGITVHDQRICLYIKTGMSSLEIAELMSVLPSSIYISRSRLRKKLGLGIDEDLYGFLNQLG